MDSSSTYSQYNKVIISVQEIKYVPPVIHTKQLLAFMKTFGKRIN